MKVVIKFLCILWLVFYVTIVHANVNPINNVGLSNGNFYINYTDMFVGKGTGFVPITRTYNSRSTYNGMFGFGWGSDIETYLIVGPSGIPTVFNIGNGARNYFDSNGTEEYQRRVSKISQETMLKILVNEELARQGKGNNEKRKQIEVEMNKQLETRESRIVLWMRLLRRGKVTPITVPVGTEFSHMCNCSYKKSTLKRTINGYQLTRGGETLEFDVGGGLVKKTDIHGNIIHIERDKSVNGQKQIRRVRINEKVIYYFYNSLGKVDRLYYPEKESIAYFHYNKSDLIYSCDSSGQRFRYSYDDRHNMVTISYSDGTTRIIKYQKNNFVSEIVNRADQVIQFEYDSLGEDPNLNYSVKITKFLDPDKKTSPKVEIYEYHSRRTKTGNIMRIKEVTVADGFRREFIFNEKGVVTEFVESSTKTPNILKVGFSFDNMGRIKSIENEGWNRDITYIDEHSTRIKKHDTQYGVEQSVYTFEYDNQDRLIIANHNDREVQISYQDDTEKNIATLRTKDYFLKVVRDDFGRVVRLNLESDGSGEVLELMYPNRSLNAKMKIKNSNPSLAYHISGILSGMLSICAPAQAGVNLEMP